MLVKIYRYNPDKDDKPYMQQYDVDLNGHRSVMVLDVLNVIKNHYDNTLAYRRSCGEGVCGSDGINVNGKNMLACITKIDDIKTNPLVIRPMPGMPVVRDLVVDMSNFYKQYERAKPFLQNDSIPPATERLQSPADREKLDGLYECILCGCCTSSCPSYWWNPDKFMGPAALLQAARFVLDSRDDKTQERLEQLDDAYSLFRCRGIMNCVDACPKGLNPTKAIADVKDQLLKEGS